MLASAAPITAVVIAVVLSSIVLLISGSNPLAAYADMVEHASKLETQVDILNRATPLYLSGVAAAIGFRMNLFNIGVEGQYRIAVLIAAAVGGAIVLPPPLHVLVIMATAMVVGAVWAGFAGYLKIKRGVHEVISTIMLNYIATGLGAFLLANWLRQETPAGAGGTSRGQPVAHGSHRGSQAPDPKNVRYGGASRDAVDQGAAGRTGRRRPFRREMACADPRRNRGT